jgi:transposase
MASQVLLYAMQQDFPELSVSRILTDRITSFHSNTGKKDFLKAHFDAVLELKNSLSSYLMSKILLWNNAYFRKTADKMFLAQYPQYRDVVTAWELQKLFRDIIFPKCEDYAKVIYQNTRLVSRGSYLGALIAKGAQALTPLDTEDAESLWKAQSKAKRAYGKTVLKSPFRNMLNYIRKVRVCYPDNPSDIKLPLSCVCTTSLAQAPLSTSLVAKLPFESKLPEDILCQWNFYTGKFGRARLIALLDLNLANFRKGITRIVFKTGSYIKAACFNKNSKKPVWHSYWTTDAENSLYKNWYVFKTTSKTVYVPLSVNTAYHSKPYDLAKEHYVSLTHKGELQVGLGYKDEVVLPEYRNARAIDVNLTGAFLADDAGGSQNFDRGWLKKAEPLIREWDALGNAKLSDFQNRKRTKLLAERDTWIRRIIGETLQRLKAEGFTDIVLENLTFYLGGSNAPRWLNKMLRSFRLSSLRTWFREQAHHLGMRVHDVPAAYSSQACECGNVDHKNRTQQKNFHCVKCGIAANADTHAAQNLYRLFHYGRDVLVRNSLVTVNEYGELTCTTKGLHSKTALKKLYENLQISYLTG